MSKEEEVKKVSFDTMANVGINKTIAGREYTILPVNIEDMGCVIGDNPDNRLMIVTRKQIENPEEEGINWQIFGLNIIEEKRKKIFMKIINKYLYYKARPMTEELIIEHGWSFKDIGEFILTWCDVSD